MKLIVLFCILLIVTTAYCVIPFALHNSAKSAIDDSLISYVNSLDTTWKAGVNDRFKGLKVKDLQVLCGLKDEIDESPMAVEDSMLSSAYPDTFDARTQWPACASIGDILDQGQCGSCWAFGAAEALSDRICISSKGAQKPILSEQDLTSCDALNMGCNGGVLSLAWMYMKNTGVVTEPCYPYLLGTCKNCTAPKCNKTCTNGAIFSTDKHHVSSYGSIARKVDAIASEILTNGPVEAGFTVYEDFFSYKSGVYQHISGAAAGGHAVKIIGWGTENVTEYWLVANSWNTNWGEKGFFKIRRGTNECGIEAQVIAGLAKL